MMPSRKSELHTAVSDYVSQVISDSVFNQFYTYVTGVINNDLESLYLYNRRYTTVQSDNPREYSIELNNDVYRLVDLYVVDPVNLRRISRINGFRIERSEVDGVDNEIFIPDGLEKGTRIEMLYKRKVDDADTDKFYNVFLQALLEQAFQWKNDPERAVFHKQLYIDNIGKENSEYHLGDNFIYPSADF